MKIKRYVAPDIRQAIQLVRAEQGPEAVILSNKRIDNGVEVIAAVDYDNKDQQLHAVAETKKVANAPFTGFGGDEQPLISSDFTIPNHTPPTPPDQNADPMNALADMQNDIKSLRSLLENQLSGLAWSDNQKPLRGVLLRRLLAMGLGSDICKHLIGDIDMGAGEEKIWHDVLDKLSAMIPIAGDHEFRRGGVLSLVGPTGVGKTTTIAKIASRYALNHGSQKVTLVTSDNYRIGGQEQLKVYSRILGIALHVMQDPSDLEQILRNAAPDQMVLIDTEGAQVRRLIPQRQFPFLTRMNIKLHNYLVISATSQRRDMEEVVNAFKGIPMDGCIITKVDECSVLGGAISVAIKHKLPVIYMSEGQRVPEDLTQASASRLVSKCVNLARNARSDGQEDEMALEIGETLDDASL